MKINFYFNRRVQIKNAVYSYILLTPLLFINYPTLSLHYGDIFVNYILHTLFNNILRGLLGIMRLMKKVIGYDTLLHF